MATLIGPAVGSPLVGEVDDFEMPRIASAKGDLLFDDRGRPYIDLLTANGAALLGHAHPAISEALARQAATLWSAGPLDCPVRDEAAGLVEAMFPPTHRLAGFCTTGMEAAEFAIRVARVATGRPGLVGFARSMHGKSQATAALAWPNPVPTDPGQTARLPFLPDVPEGVALDRLESVLRAGETAAVFVEPILGSGGGHRPSRSFHLEVAALCKSWGALLVWDEILTGFHRTGDAFVFQEIGLAPDLVLVGKAMGNGFPVSAVVADQAIAIRPQMLPGSTFGGNALAAAAVRATCRAMAGLDLPARVAAIEEIVTTRLAPLASLGASLRGRGALWVLELPDPAWPGLLAGALWREGVCAGHARGFVRVLPSALIEPSNLAAACEILRDQALRLAGGPPR